MDARIEKIELFKVNIPQKEPFKIALDTIYDAENVFVKITTAEGLTGWGECSPFQVIHGETQSTCYEVGLILAKGLLHQNVLAMESNIAKMNAIIPGNYCIKSAFDMALYDLSAQIAGLPLYAFLGGQNNRPLFTDMTLGIDSPQIMAKKALGFQQDGFYALKIKLGTNFQDDVQRMKAIREAVGYEIPLRIDANQGWSPSLAKQILKALEKYQPEYCEAPMSRKFDSALPTLRQITSVPIMADESLFDHYDALRLAKSESVDFFNIKLGKSGGIFNALKITAIAEASGIPCQVGCFSESRLGITALAHFALSKNIIHHFDMDSPLMIAKDPIVGGITYGPGGTIHLPDSIGIGASLNTAPPPTD